MKSFNIISSTIIAIDFTKVKVRVTFRGHQGSDFKPQTTVADKFSVCSLLDRVTTNIRKQYMYGSEMMYNYAEAKAELLKALETAQYDDLTIIK